MGYRFRKHVSHLPGRPDLVFPRARVIVFIDGDFWHGYRLPTWESHLSKFWREKIQRNRERDKRTFAKLRAMGWNVIRLWQHQVERDPDQCIRRIVSAVSGDVSDGN
jgi:DNA mismatch endonuclease (patch repair protein)